jgi:hypothetical protein
MTWNLKRAAPEDTAAGCKTSLPKKHDQMEDDTDDDDDRVNDALESRYNTKKQAATSSESNAQGDQGSSSTPRQESSAQSSQRSSSAAHKGKGSSPGDNCATDNKKKQVCIVKLVKRSQLLCRWLATPGTRPTRGLGRAQSQPFERTKAMSQPGEAGGRWVNMDQTSTVQHHKSDFTSTGYKSTAKADESQEERERRMKKEKKGLEATGMDNTFKYHKAPHLSKHRTRLDDTEDEG